MMASRPLTAEDIVYTFNYVDQSQRRIATYFEHIDAVEARDDHTVVFHFNRYNAEWAYRFGYGYYSAIIPKESANVDSRTGATHGHRPVPASSATCRATRRCYRKNPDYWGTERIGDEDYPIPFVDAVNYRIIKDEATYLTALRTGKLDILEGIRWIALDHLKETTPELKWSAILRHGRHLRRAAHGPKPFDDIRVRRAMNLAVNQQEIVELFYGGHAELMAYPQHPDFGGVSTNRSKSCPQRSQELYDLQPREGQGAARRGWLPGWLRVRRSGLQLQSAAHGYGPAAGRLPREGRRDDEIEAAGVRVVSLDDDHTNHGPGYLMASGHCQPDHRDAQELPDRPDLEPRACSATPRSTPRSWRCSPCATMTSAFASLARSRANVISQAPYVWLPTGIRYTAWWPWVKNYNGELRAGAVRPGPIYARIWIDQELKRDMGF